MNNFCVFILSHGRADNIKTLKALESANYTGDWYIVIDNEDDTAEEYYKRYGDKVIMFDKLEMSKEFDTYDNFSDRRTIVYARNACFKIAKKLGYRYFLQCDDDYESFEYRFEKEKKLMTKPCLDFNKLCEMMLEFLNNTNAQTVCLAQGGDFIGGLEGGNWKKGILRKVMNSFFCDVERPFQFVGRINEDVNTYTTLGFRGVLMLTVTRVMLTQTTTQTNANGMTQIYLDGGTYLKSFYSVISCPSAVKISLMGDKNKRLHHKIYWNNCVPKIISEEYKRRK